MTGFIVGAALLALLAVLFVTLPLLRGRGSLPPAATAAMIGALALIGPSAVIYSLIGNPNAARLSSGRTDAAENIAALARHLEQHPDDTGSWVLLGAAYGASGQYALALHAYEHADRLTNGGDATVLADMGEAMLLGGNQAQLTEATALLERALQIDSKSAKALFYSALIAFRAGHLEVARTRFATMLTLTPPPPDNLRVALQRQIDQIDTQLHPRVDAATAIHLRVSLAAALAHKVPPNSSLFVFVRSPDGGPPLAAKRSANALPQEVELSAADAMIATRTVQPGQKVTVVARISGSGSPLPQSGDLYGQIDYVAGQAGPRALEINKLTP